MLLILHLIIEDFGKTRGLDDLRRKQDEARISVKKLKAAYEGYSDFVKGSPAMINKMANAEEGLAEATAAATDVQLQALRAAV